MPRKLTEPLCCPEADTQLYDHLHHRCSTEEIHNIVTEAVELEKEFLTEALPCSLIGINAKVS
jgi:ribonucleotide reductase beta subunit family protein with ferritin-like domain